MGQFDQIVDEIVRRIAAAQDAKRREAEGVSTSAENAFGHITGIVGELQPKLAAKFPDQKPSVSLTGWVKSEDGAGATNTLKLKSVARDEKEIPLGIVFGRAEVTIGGSTIASANSLNTLYQEIVRFFTEG